MSTMILYIHGAGSHKKKQKKIQKQKAAVRAALRKNLGETWKDIDLVMVDYTEVFRSSKGEPVRAQAGEDSSWATVINPTGEADATRHGDFGGVKKSPKRRKCGCGQCSSSKKKKWLGRLKKVVSGKKGAKFAWKVRKEHPGYTKDINKYIEKPGVRAKVHRHIARQLNGRSPDVIIGHSLGSLIAVNFASLMYDEPETVILLGSPIRLKKLRKKAFSTVRKHVKKGRSYRLVNVYDKNDWLTTSRSLEDEKDLGPTVNVKVRNKGKNAHSDRGYVSHKVVRKEVRGVVDEAARQTRQAA